MARKIGYYKTYNQTPDDPISIAPEIYVDRDGGADSTWYLRTGKEREIALSFKELVALRDAFTKAIDDADDAIAREAARVNKVMAEHEKLMAKRMKENNTESV